MEKVVERFYATPKNIPLLTLKAKPVRAPKGKWFL
jgi:hypothetical protein